MGRRSSRRECDQVPLAVACIGVVLLALVLVGWYGASPTAGGAAARLDAAVRVDDGAGGAPPEDDPGAVAPPARRTAAPRGPAPRVYHDAVPGMRGALGYPDYVDRSLLRSRPGATFPLAEGRWGELLGFMNREVSSLHRELPRCPWTAPPARADAAAPGDSLPRSRLVLWALAEIDAKFFQGLGVLYYLSGRTEAAAVRAGGLAPNAPWATVTLMISPTRVRPLFRRMRAAFEADDPFRHIATAGGKVRLREDGDASRLAVEFVPHRGSQTAELRRLLGPTGWMCSQSNGECTVRLVTVLASRRGDDPERLCRCPFRPLRTGLVCRVRAPSEARNAFGS